MEHHFQSQYDLLQMMWLIEHDLNCLVLKAVEEFVDLDDDWQMQLMKEYLDKNFLSVSWFSIPWNIHHAKVTIIRGDLQVLIKAQLAAVQSTIMIGRHWDQDLTQCLWHLEKFFHFVCHETVWLQQWAPLSTNISIKNFLNIWWNQNTLIECLGYWEHSIKFSS